jgi:hypothetical protein
MLSLSIVTIGVFSGDCLKRSEQMAVVISMFELDEKGLGRQ